MIENYNSSKDESTSLEALNIRKFIGVASISILAVNPDNSVMRKYGWEIPLAAEEPKYVVEKEKDGKYIKRARVRFLAQINDFTEKPVIALDFWVGPNAMVSNKNNIKKCQVIDDYTYTAWVTEEEFNSKRVPANSKTDTKYRVCHSGEEDLLKFIFKFLNITPKETFDSKGNIWVQTKNPGKLTIDKWKELCEGDPTEVKSYIALMPENKVKVVLGVTTNDKNKSYQTFLSKCFIGNGASVDNQTGEYTTARKAIDKYNSELEKSGRTSNTVYSAFPVKEWSVTPTDVKDQSSNEFPTTSLEDENFGDIENDLPFEG